MSRGNIGLKVHFGIGKGMYNRKTLVPIECVFEFSANPFLSYVGNSRIFVPMFEFRFPEPFACPTSVPERLPGRIASYVVFSVIQPRKAS